MKMLAFEFSSPQRSVAVVEADEGGQVHVRGQITHWALDNKMMPLHLVEDQLRSVGLEREQIQAIIVGLGPGSYTGVRAAIALAQGWQLGRGVKLLGVSSAASVALWAHAKGLRGRVNVAIDAQRGEFYLSGYELGTAAVQEISPLRIASRAEVQAQAGAQVIGPEVTKWFPGAQIEFPQAAMLGRLAAGRSDFVAGEKLEPIYLREITFVKAPLARILTGL